MNYFGNIAKDMMLEGSFFFSFNLYSKVLLPEFPEDGYPDVPEMDSIKENVSSFYAAWRQMETAISDSFTQILNMEIAGKTPEELLQKVVEIMESKGCCNHNIYCREQAILLKVL